MSLFQLAHAEVASDTSQAFWVSGPYVTDAYKSLTEFTVGKVWLQVHNENTM